MLLDKNIKDQSLLKRAGGLWELLYKKDSWEQSEFSDMILKRLSSGLTVELEWVFTFGQW